MPVATQRFARDGEIVRAFELECTEVRVPSHQHHLQHGEVERRMRFLRHDGDLLRDRASGQQPKLALDRAAPSRASGLSTPDSSFSSVVLPQPFGPSRPVSEPRRDADADVVQRELERLDLSTERGTRIEIRVGKTIGGECHVRAGVLRAEEQDYAG